MGGFVEKGVEALLSGVSIRWEDPIALVIASVASVVAGTTVLTALGITPAGLPGAAFLGVLFAGTLGAWFATTRVPRTRGDAVGFGVALEFEDPRHASQVENDLVRELRDLLETGKSKSKFQLLQFSPRQSARLDSHGAKALAEKSRCHFLIHGRARLRKLGGKQVHAFVLDGLVHHRPIPLAESDKLGREFRELFPRKWRIADENALLAFEFTAAEMGIVARYVVGIASFLSGDFGYAEELFLALERDLSNATGRLPSTTKIRNRLGARLGEVYSAWALAWGERYRLGRSKDDLRQLEKIVEKLQSRFPDDYSAHLYRAITAFVLWRDIDRARSEIEACSKNEDPTWMYSLAFLRAYVGDLQGAYKMYRDAARAAHTDLSTPVQAEEFIQHVLDEEPDKTQLFFCLGMLNYRLKGDLPAAHRDLSRFLHETPADTHQPQRSAATKWLTEIDAALQLRAEGGEDFRR